MKTIIIGLHQGLLTGNETSRWNDTHYYRSSHRSPSQCLPRKSRLRHDYRGRTKRTPSESPTRQPRHSHRHTKYHTPSHHSRTGERHQERKQFHSRHADYVYSSKYRSRRHYSPTSSSCSSSSDNESPNSDSEYTSDDSFHSSESSSDDCYSPERHYHQPYRRRFYMRSIAVTKTTDLIINQGVCCCLKVEKIQIM